MATPTPEQYDAACILERWATAEEGERREISRRILLDGGWSAQDAANHARASVCHAVAAVERSIEALGLQ